MKHVSVHTRAQLDEVGFTGNYTYGLWIIEPGGQSIQTGGIINDEEFSYYASAGSPQWCVWPCDHDLVAGTVDPSRIYGIDEFTARNGGGIPQKEGIPVREEEIQDSLEKVLSVETMTEEDQEKSEDLQMENGDIELGHVREGAEDAEVLDVPDLDLNEEILFEPQQEVVFNERMMEYVAVAILVVAVIGNIWLCIYAKNYGKSNDRHRYAPIQD